MAGHAVVVGASLGGLRAAEQLVSAGWDGPVTVVGAERHMPYNRPPLSKEVLRELPATGSPRECADGAHERVAFRLRDSLGAVAWRLGCRAIAASLAERSVILEDGSELHYDALVIATGLRPRSLSLPGAESDRFVLRTLDDAARLRRRLEEGTRVVVIGGGFIGCEIAATATQLGCRVTVVEPEPAPMARALGPALGAALARHHGERGVDFRLGRTVAAFRTAGPEGRLVGVTLDDGSELDADVVVEAVGSVPNTEWLERNGLDLDDGVLCDNHLRVEGRPDVVAVGDVARFPNPLFDDVPRRVEHWSVPTDTAKRAAATLAALQRPEPPDPAPFAPMPSFWSDQFDLRIQGVGAFALGERYEVLEGSLEEDLSRGVAVGAWREGRLVGAITIGLPASRSIHYRRQITQAAMEVLA